MPGLPHLKRRGGGAARQKSENKLYLLTCVLWRANTWLCSSWSASSTHWQYAWLPAHTFTPSCVPTTPKEKARQPSSNRLKKRAVRKACRGNEDARRVRRRKRN